MTIKWLALEIKENELWIFQNHHKWQRKIDRSQIEIIEREVVSAPVSDIDFEINDANFDSNLHEDVVLEEAESEDKERQEASKLLWNNSEDIERSITINELSLDQPTFHHVYVMHCTKTKKQICANAFNLFVKLYPYLRMQEER